MDPRVLSPLARFGLNTSGVADGRGWDHVVPGCRSILVVGSGGPALWEAFLRAGPTPQRDPLDTFVRERVLAVVPSQSGRWVFSADAPDIDFRSLAVAAGLGWPSRLGLVLHPVYGPWLGLRAAWFTPELWTPTGPLSAVPPCVGCPAPCVTACPGLAVRDRFDIVACSAFRETDDRCATTCHSRDACPVGAEHRYPADERRYHTTNGSDPGRPAPRS